MGLLNDFFGIADGGGGSILTGGFESGGGNRGSTIGGAIGAIFGPQGQMIGSSLGGTLSQAIDPETPIPDSGPIPGGTYPDMIPTAGILGAAGRLATMGPLVISAVSKLYQRLGGPARSAGSYAMRIWGQITGWVQKNPGTSAIALLTGLGLTAEEAAHFLAWGATNKRRRRARGITSRDLRTTRRTMRKVITMSRQLSELCSSSRTFGRKRRK